METDIKTDSINPSHYGAGAEHECIDVMVQQYGIEAVRNFCNLNAFKYLFRSQRKGRDVEDLKKARWYIDKYLELSVDARIIANAQKLEERDRNATRSGFEQFVAWKGGDR